jgi:ABC-type Fe3+/spermidine/putrescine transport system ATPase subunit
VTSILQCTDLRKQYPGQDDYALGDEQKGVSFSVERGELFALLGPSGCGKTTSLRIVGGFTDASSGRVTIDGADVTDQPAHRRPVNTVFQSYALFPHMSVGANVAFGLAMAGVKKAESRQRVAAALDQVGLGGWEKRKVTELSGGQAQRCALARALVNRPAVLLLDEPLGALDLKLRRQMQDELVHLKATTEMAFVHVTHDQEEACAIADRIAVMHEGHIVQVDSPLDLYRRPKTAYVAGFIDAGSIVRGVAVRTSDSVEVSSSDLVVRGPAPADLNGSRAVAAVIPPGCVHFARGEDAADAPGVSGVVERTTFTGSVFETFVRVSDALEIRVATSPERASELDGVPAVGERVTLRWRPEDVIFVSDDAPGTDAHANPTEEPA